MKCTEFMSLLPLYPDAMPDEATKAEFLLHAAECPQCAEKLAEQEVLLSSLSSLDDDLEIPESFGMGWRTAVEVDAQASKKPKRRGWQGWVAAAATLVVVIGGTALMRGGFLFSAKDTSETAVLYEAAPQALYYEAEAPTAVLGGGEVSSAKRSSDDVSYRSMPESNVIVEDEMDQTSSDTGEGAQDAVVLKSASITLDSEQYDVDFSQIVDLLDEYGGWMEYQSVNGEALEKNPESGRYAYLRVRVPADALDAFMAALNNIGRVTGSETASEDVSSSYYDVQGRLSMYTAQRDKLTDLLTQAENMSDIIEIESRLSEVQYTIESLTGRLNNWDARAKSAVVSISINEIAKEREYARKPLSQRLSDTLATSLLSIRAFLADMLVFLVMAAPYIVCVAGIAVVGYIIYRIIKRKRRNEQ